MTSLKKKDEEKGEKGPRKLGKNSINQISLLDPDIEAWGEDTRKKIGGSKRNVLRHKKKDCLGERELGDDVEDSEERERKGEGDPLLKNSSERGWDKRLDPEEKRT